MWVAPFPTNWALDWVKERKLSISVCALLAVPDCGGDMASFCGCDFPTVVDRHHLDLTERNPFFPKLLLLECCIAATETKLRQTEVYDSLHPL